MLITAVSGTQNFTDARIRVDDAIRDYNAAIADLGLDIGLKTKEKTEEVLVTVQETKNVLFGIMISFCLLKSIRSRGC
jgi:hypothetical protein